MTGGYGLTVSDAERRGSVVVRSCSVLPVFCRIRELNTRQQERGNAWRAHTHLTRRSGANHTTLGVASDQARLTLYSIFLTFISRTLHASSSSRRDVLRIRLGHDRRAPCGRQGPRGNFV